MADFGLGDGLPVGFALDFGVGKELVGFSMKKDGVVVDSVLLESLLRVGPDGIVAFDLLFVRVRIEGYNESFADHS